MIISFKGERKTGLKSLSENRTLLLGQFIFGAHGLLSFNCNNCINNKCGISGLCPSTVSKEAV